MGSTKRCPTPNRRSVDLPTAGRRIFPYVQGGPAFAWRIDCGVTVDAASGSNTTSCDDLQRDNLEETFRDREQGLVLGAGVDVPVFGIGAVNVDARFTRGLSRVAQGDDIRNRALSVMLGYSFGLSGRLAGAGGGMPGMR